MPDPELAAALRRVARTPRLLVASDYDGVLAPIVNDPAMAVPLPAAVAVLRALAALPDTTVVAVSGRARGDLAAVSGLPPEVLLVGGHGAELGDGIRLDPEQAALRARLEAAAGELVAAHPGTRLETKPASVVVHTRTAASRGVAAAAAQATLAGPATWPGVHVTTGKEVVELAVLTTHKGTAVEALRTRSGAGAVVFLGDDVTDENAFAVLGEGDVGIKVGPGDTRARFRVSDPAAAVRTLEFLLRARTSAPA
jgi:trehalose-phosphatase